MSAQIITALRLRAAALRDEAERSLGQDVLFKTRLAAEFRLLADEAEGLRSDGTGRRNPVPNPASGGPQAEL